MCRIFSFWRNSKKKSPQVTTVNFTISSTQLRSLSSTQRESLCTSRFRVMWRDHITCFRFRSFFFSSPPSIRFYLSSLFFLCMQSRERESRGLFLSVRTVDQCKKKLQRAFIQEGGRRELTSVSLHHQKAILDKRQYSRDAYI